jgi:hypothetical protein
VYDDDRDQSTLVFDEPFSGCGSGYHEMGPDEPTANHPTPGIFPCDDEQDTDEMASDAACQWITTQVKGLTHVRCTSEWNKTNDGWTKSWFTFIRDGEAGAEGTTQGGGISEVSAMDSAAKAVVAYRERVAAKVSLARAKALDAVAASAEGSVAA